METLMVMIKIFAIIFLMLSALLIIYFVWNILKKEQIKSSAGIFLLDIDLNNNRLKKTNIIELEEEASLLEYFEDGWMDIDFFLNKLSEENKEKFLTALDILKTNKKYVKFILKNKSSKEPNQSIQWIIELFKTNKSINANIEWSYIENIPSDLKIITKEEIFENNSQFQSFIAFNLKRSDQLFFQSFILILFENIKIKNKNFFVSKNILILIIFGDDIKKIDKEVSLIIKRIEKIKATKQLLYYYDALGIVEAIGVSDSHDLLKIINRIYFSLIKSSQLKKPFYFNIKNIFFNEFEEFKENYSILNKIIKNKDIPSIEVPIIEVKTNKVIANYIKPVPVYPDNFWVKMIIENKNILPNLEDSYFNKMLNSLKKLDQYLIDVNDYMIVQNMEKLKNHKSMIFIIKFIDLTNIKKLELIVSNLKNNNIKFGIKIEKVVPEIITLIESIMPHAIIISESLIDSSDLRSLLNLKQLIFLCKKNPATLIFENPAKFELSKKEINYFYNK